MTRPPIPQIVEYRRHLLVCTGRSCVADGMDAAGLIEVGHRLMAAGVLRDAELRLKQSRVDCLGACRSGPAMCVQPGRRPGVPPGPGGGLKFKCLPS